MFEENFQLIVLVFKQAMHSPSKLLATGYQLATTLKTFFARHSVLGDQYFPRIFPFLTTSNLMEYTQPPQLIMSPR